MAPKPIPNGYHSITPYLTIDGAAKAIDFYKHAFGATELFRMAMPDGKLAHAEIQIGDSRIMLGDEHPQQSCRGPKALGGSPVGLMLYVPEVDAWFERAVKAGATVTRPLQNQFYGDRSGSLTDPFGHVWTISSHIEDVSEEEIMKRAKAMGMG